MTFGFGPRYYRRDGTAYPKGDKGMFEWAEDMKNMELRIVKQDLLPNGMWVSTVWLGINHNWLGGPPLIFETMASDAIDEWTDYQVRYSTEADAIIGHLEAVDLLKHTWCIPAIPIEQLAFRKTNEMFRDMNERMEQMALACRICVAEAGLKGSEIENLPTTYDELYDHVERVHHIVVSREGEDEDQARARFLAANPSALDCDDCRQRGAPWATPKEAKTNGTEH